MLRETRLAPTDLIQPLFVVPGRGVREPIPSLPRQCHVSADEAAREAVRAWERGVGGVLLFGLPSYKDEEGSSAWDDGESAQSAIRLIKERAPELPLITDVCLCQYTSHGACGVLADDGDVDNDATLELLGRVAVSHAEDGADIVAPSDMMDGRVRAVRDALDDAGFVSRAIMAYSSKFASAMYGPFRDAADSAPASGDRRGYQLDPANPSQALLESLLDAEEGADVLMVKPALPYLDVLARLRERTLLPLAAYQDSGEYAMLHAGAAASALDEQAAALETLVAMRRAGADLFITYFASEAAAWLS